MNAQNFDIKDIQKTTMQFQMQMEKQDLIAEQMNEAMDMDDEDELDEEAEKIIQDIEFKAGGGG